VQRGTGRRLAYLSHKVLLAMWEGGESANLLISFGRMPVPKLAGCARVLGCRRRSVPFGEPNDSSYASEPSTFDNMGSALSALEAWLLVDTQRGALPFPRCRQRLKQLIKLKRARLAPSQDRLDDLWRE